MGIVATKLQEQQLEFISLYELLETIAEHDKCTLQQAAKFLNGIVFRDKTFPWETNDSLFPGAATQGQADKALELLRYIVVRGEYMPEPVLCSEDDSVPF